MLGFFILKTDPSLIFLGSRSGPGFVPSPGGAPFRYSTLRLAPGNIRLGRKGLPRPNPQTCFITESEAKHIKLFWRKFTRAFCKLDHFINAKIVE
jgi:hypothetical protein